MLKIVCVSEENPEMRARSCGISPRAGPGEAGVRGPGRRPRGLVAVTRVYQRRADLSRGDRGRQGSHSAGGSASEVRPDAVSQPPAPAGLAWGPVLAFPWLPRGPATLGDLGSQPRHGSPCLCVPRPLPGVSVPGFPPMTASDLIVTGYLSTGPVPNTVTVTGPGRT